MSDVVVTVPQRLWSLWLAEGDRAGDPPTGDLYDFTLAGGRPDISPGERVYIVAHGRLRGYAPLFAIGEPDDIVAWRGEPSLRAYSLIRSGGAVAVTIPEPIRGFRGFRYRWWSRSAETPFANWMTP